MIECLYEIEQCPNPNVVQLHLRQRVPGKMFKGYGSDRPEYRACLESTGVTDVSVGITDPYSASVSKGSMFTWDEVLPELIPRLGAVLGFNLVERPARKPAPPVTEDPQGEVPEYISRLASQLFGGDATSVRMFRMVPPQQTSEPTTAPAEADGPKVLDDGVWIRSDAADARKVIVRQGRYLDTQSGDWHRTELDPADYVFVRALRDDDLGQLAFFPLKD